MNIIRIIFSPLFFSVGFLTPLISQVLTSCGLSIASFDNLYVGLAIAVTWGLMAQIRGSWIWVTP